jgi:transcription elongation GreA/GreB family factor
MNKKDIHRRLVEQAQQELEAITVSAKSSFAAATSEQHRAEGKYDTFKLESSFLSRGLAKRVAELTNALEALQAIPLPKLAPNSPVQVGALVRLKCDDGTPLVLFLGTDAGGETIIVGRKEINVVSSGSPLGQAVLNKRVGDTFKIMTGKATHTFTVLSVE